MQQRVTLCGAALFCVWSRLIQSFSLIDYTHYLDYLPNRMDGDAHY